MEIKSKTYCEKFTKYPIKMTFSPLISSPKPEQNPYNFPTVYFSLSLYFSLQALLVIALPYGFPFTVMKRTNQNHMLSISPQATKYSVQASLTLLSSQDFHSVSFKMQEEETIFSQDNPSIPYPETHINRYYTLFLLLQIDLQYPATSVFPIYRK